MFKDAYGQDTTATIWVDFKWKLPETCEIVYKESWEVVDDDSVQANTDGTFSKKRVEAVVNCSDEKMMSALFKRGIKNGV